MLWGCHEPVRVNLWSVLCTSGRSVHNQHRWAVGNHASPAARHCLRRTLAMSSTIHTAKCEEVLAVLNNLKDLPTSFNDWLVELGTDSIDEPAVWVWVILERDSVGYATISQVHPIVQNAIMALMGPAWVYVGSVLPLKWPSFREPPRRSTRAGGLAGPQRAEMSPAG